MPYSHPAFDTKVKSFLKSHPFNNYFDIGSGAGKWGRLIKDLFPNANLIGIEAEKSYIKDFKLKDIYDQIINTYIEDYIDKYPDFTTDIAIIGDCIEHLNKSDGINLINYLVYRTRFIIIIYPTKCVEYSWRGHHTEAHRSIWSKEDFKQFNSTYFKKGFMNLVILRGYIGDPETEYVED